VDIKVVTEPSISGKRYCPTIVDDYSRWKVAIPMDKKGETVHALLDWINIFVIPMGASVRYIRCDNSKENAYMARIVANKWIATQFTNKYSSASNGIAERGIKSIFGTVRAMLINANLPHKYWGEAVYCQQNATVLTGRFIPFTSLLRTMLTTRSGEGSPRRSIQSWGIVMRGPTSFGWEAVKADGVGFAIETSVSKP
jgi:hypothetical protein